MPSSQYADLMFLKHSALKTITPASGYTNPKDPLLLVAPTGIDPLFSKPLANAVPSEPDTKLNCLPKLVIVAEPEEVTLSSVRK